MRRSSVLRSILGTLLGGALVGFVAVAILTAMGASGTLTGRAAEAPAARSYLVDLLSGNTNGANDARVDEGVILKAERAQNDAPASSWSATGLSYLGGAESGGLGVYVYVARIRPADGSQEQDVPFTLTVSGGKVVRVQ